MLNMGSDNQGQDDHHQTCRIQYAHTCRYMCNLLLEKKKKYLSTFIDRKIPLRLIYIYSISATSYSTNFSVGNFHFKQSTTLAKHLYFYSSIIFGYF